MTFIAMFPLSEQLPRAYGGCTCQCHRTPGVKHIMPCCYPSQTLEEAIGEADQQMRVWTNQAALGQCSWICADCSMTFSEGMPDECPHGHQSCTDIIKRDKAEALKLKEA